MPKLSPESEIANRFQLVSRLADDLAHEIKNPLNSMVINIEVLRSRARKGDTPGVLERADVLEAEVRRLNGLIDGMLKLLRPARAVSGDEIPLDPVLEELGDLVGLQAKLARKALTVSPIGDAAVARGQRDAIRFALLNLLAGELDAATGDEASVAVGGDAEEEGITIRIATTSAPIPPVSDLAARREAAVDIARSLLASAEGEVQVEDRVLEQRAERTVTVRLKYARRA
jgi:signal transduction histidine kinase